MFYEHKDRYIEVNLVHIISPMGHLPCNEYSSVCTIRKAFKGVIICLKIH